VGTGAEVPAVANEPNAGEVRANAKGWVQRHASSTFVSFEDHSAEGDRRAACFPGSADENLERVFELSFF